MSNLNQNIICAIIFYLSAIVYSNCNAQQIIMSGKVLGSVQKPLEYANILAIPSIEDSSVKFAITESDGSFKLGLSQN